MKNKRSNWQIVFSVILMFAVWFGALPVFGQTRQDGKGVGVRVVSELPPKEKRWALIVGIDKYDRDVSTLQGAVNDAKALKNVLVNYAGFPENQVVLLTSDAAEADNLPKRENILSALGDLSQRVPPDGLLLFSFSGHGVSVGSQAFLIPSNGRITKNLSLLRSLSINVKDIQEAIQEIKVKQVLMLLDACRNEPGKGDTPNVLTDAYKEGFSFDVVNSEVKAFATLFATSVGERAFEFYDKESKQFRGYFSHAVEEALKGKAANDKGEVTLSGLINYLETTVPKKVKYDKGETQVPTAAYSDSYRANQLILSVANKSNNNSLTSAQIAWNNFRGLAKSLVKYNSVSPFSEELLIVRVGNLLNGRYGLISRRGDEVIELKYAEILPLYNGLSRVRVGDIFDGKIGFINNKGQEVISPKYSDAGVFTEEMACVKIGNKFGLIDKTEKIIIQPNYDSCFPFSEALAGVKIGNKYGFINKAGSMVIAPTYDNVWFFQNGLAMVQVKGKYGFINKLGREIIPIKYDALGGFSEGLSPAKIGNKYGFIDKNEKWIIPPKYDFAWGFSEGVSSVKIGDKYGLIDKTGREIISPKYEFLNSFSNSLANVQIGDKVGIIDKAGREVISVKYNHFWCMAFMNEGFIGVELNGKKGFVDIYGNEYFDF